MLSVILTVRDINKQQRTKCSHIKYLWIHGNVIKSCTVYVERSGFLAYGRTDHSLDKRLSTLGVKGDLSTGTVLEMWSSSLCVPHCMCTNAPGRMHGWNLTLADAGTGHGKSLVCLSHAVFAANIQCLSVIMVRRSGCGATYLQELP